MKKITILLFCFITMASMAQSKETDYSKWLFKLGVNIVDNTGDRNPFNAVELKKRGYTNNIAAGIEYRFHKHWSAGFFLSNNKFKAPEAELDGEFITENRSYFATDVNLKYYLWSAQYEDVTSNRFNIYASAGTGLFNIESNTVSINAGGGLVYWFNNSFGVNLESIAKWTTENDVKYDSNHFQYFAGITYRTSKKDRDRDGITDSEDACPDNFGLIEFNGCPDSDNDGIADNIDKCINTFGPKENNGCPYKDSDKDGVLDKDDKCVHTFGPKENNGCPYKDTDKDGVLDKDDKCPNVKGIVENNGCPKVITQVVKDKVNKILKDYAKSIYFHTGKYSFTENSYSILQEIASKLKEFPNSEIIIEGHTDSVAPYISNQVLSQQRANAVAKYLGNNGLQRKNIEDIGYGESKPEASNNSKKGRALNRRVVIRIK